MSDYINPDAPNPEVSAAMARSMQMNNSGYAPTSTSGYYPGGYANPFAPQNNASYSPESRANIGPAPTGMPMQYPYGQVPQAQPQYQQPVQCAPAFNSLAEMKTVCNPAVDAVWAAQFNQTQVPSTGYAGYPLGVENNYIYDYVRSHPTTKPTWGENYWTAPKPIDPPMIDWTPKQQEAPVYPYQQYGYGYANQPQQPALPQNFAFPAVEQSYLDIAKKTWSDWSNL